jgi:hypothetical protein
MKGGTITLGREEYGGGVDKCQFLNFMGEGAWMWLKCVEGTNVPALPASADFLSFPLAECGPCQVLSLRIMPNANMLLWLCPPRQSKACHPPPGPPSTLHHLFPFHHPPSQPLSELHTSSQSAHIPHIPQSSCSAWLGDASGPPDVSLLFVTLRQEGGQSLWT